MNSFLVALTLFVSANALPQPVERLCLANNASDFFCNQETLESDFIESSLASCLENASEDLLKIIPCYEEAITQNENILHKGDPYLFEIRQNLSIHYETMGNVSLANNDHVQAFNFFQKEFTLLVENQKIVYTKVVFWEICRNFFYYKPPVLQNQLQKRVLSFFERFSIEEDLHYLALSQKLSFFCQKTLSMQKEKQLSHTILYLLDNTIYKDIEIIPPHVVERITDAYGNRSYDWIDTKLTEWFYPIFKTLQKIYKRRRKLILDLRDIAEKIPKKFSEEEFFYLEKIYQTPSLEGFDIGNISFEKLPEKLADFYYDKGVAYKKERQGDEAMLFFKRAYPLYEYMGSKKIAYIHYHSGAIYFGLDGFKKNDPNEGCAYAYNISTRYFDWFSLVYVNSLSLKTSCHLKYVLEEIEKRWYVPSRYSAFIIVLGLVPFLGTAIISLLVLMPFRCFFVRKTFAHRSIPHNEALQTIDFIDETTLFSFSEKTVYPFEIKKKGKKTEIEYQKYTTQTPLQKATVSLNKAFVYFEFATDIDEYGICDLQETFPKIQYKTPKIEKGVWLPSEKLLGFHENVLCIHDPFSGEKVYDTIFCESHPTPVGVKYAQMGKYAISASEDELFFWNMSERYPQYKVDPSCVNYPVYQTYQKFLNETCSQEVEKLILNYLGGYLFGHQKVNCGKIIDFVITDEERKIILLTDSQVVTYNMSMDTLHLELALRDPIDIKIEPRYIKCSPDGEEKLVHGKYKKEDAVYSISKEDNPSRCFCRSKNKKRCQILYCKGNRVNYASFLPDKEKNQIALVYEYWYKSWNITELCLSRSLVNKDALIPSCFAICISGYGSLAFIALSLPLLQ